MKHLSQLYTVLKSVCSSTHDCCVQLQIICSTIIEKREYTRSDPAHADGYLMVRSAESDRPQTKGKMLGRSATLVKLITCEIKATDASISLTRTSTDYEISKRHPDARITKTF